MKKYVVDVVYSYWHVMDVDADNEEEAKQKAFDRFSIDLAYQGEGEVYSIKEIKKENEE